jgi:hypothetical protein
MQVNIDKIAGVGRKLHRAAQKTLSRPVSGKDARKLAEERRRARAEMQRKRLERKAQQEAKIGTRKPRQKLTGAIALALMLAAVGYVLFVRPAQEAVSGTPLAGGGGKTASAETIAAAKSALQIADADDLERRLSQLAAASGLLLQGIVVEEVAIDLSVQGKPDGLSASLRLRGPPAQAKSFIDTLAADYRIAKGEIRGSGPAYLLERVFVAPADDGQIYLEVTVKAPRG